MPHRKKKSGGTVIRRGSEAEERIRTDPNLQFGEGGVAPLASPKQPSGFFVGGETQIKEGGELVRTPEKVSIEDFRRLRDKIPEEPVIAPELEEKLATQFEERQVGKQPEIVPIISPEQENLGVMLRIAKSAFKSVFTKSIIQDQVKDYLKRSETETIPLAEITMIEEDLKESVMIETSAEIDIRMVETENGLMQEGLLPPTYLPPRTEQVTVAGVAAGAGAVLVAQTVTRPLGEFIGTDGQIASLELALSQYNEMITIPARSVATGLPTDIAFDKLDRMEEGILALESQLKISALTSPKVALALRGRGVEARLLKLKEKLQESRRIVFLRTTQEALGEVDVPRSMAFLRRLQNEREARK